MKKIVTITLICLLVTLVAANSVFAAKVLRLGHIRDTKHPTQLAALKFKELTDLVCTGCKYCMPCPNEVNIAAIFESFIRYQVYNQLNEAKRFYAFVGKHPRAPGKNASACVECGECLEKCPQNIPIIEQLKKAHQVLGQEHP